MLSRDAPQVESHGRRFWRRQTYASDARFSLCFLQPSTQDRRFSWPAWGRYEAGAAGLPSPAPSAVITREATVLDNLAGTDEVFVPTRYLCGVLPSALLESHHFWLDDLDNIRGYPHARDEKTGLYEHVLLIETDKMSSRVGPWPSRTRVSRRVLKEVRAAWTADELEVRGSP